MFLKFHHKNEEQIMGAINKSGQNKMKKISIIKLQNEAFLW